MTNPVTKWEMQDFSIEFDVSKLMENFFNLRSFSTYGVIHTHHIQSVVITYGSTIAGGAAATVGSPTWPDPFPSGVVPIVHVNVNETGALLTGEQGLICEAFNITNTGCDIRVFNATGTTLAAGSRYGVTAIDSTYNVSLA